MLSRLFAFLFVFVSFFVFPTETNKKEVENFGIVFCFFFLFFCGFIYVVFPRLFRWYGPFRAWFKFVYSIYFWITFWWSFQVRYELF
jgi:hypothetical protein